MELRRISMLALFVLAVTVKCSDGHTVKRREAYPLSADYDTQNDPATDDDTQNDDTDEEVKAEIVNAGETFYARVGENVVLPCDIKPSPRENLGVAFQWMKDNVRLSINSIIVNTDAFPSISIDELTKSNIVINKYTPADNGHYTCSILESDVPKDDPRLLSITHILATSETTDAPHAYDDVQKPIITELTVSHQHVQEGSDVYISCKATGNPQPKISWSREDSNGRSHRLTEEDAEITANSITIRQIKHEEGGKYICMADNKIGYPALKQIPIKVLGKPRVHVHKELVNSAKDVTAVLQCTAHREPYANIHWYKDGQRIEDSERQFTVSTNGQESNLTVTPEKDEDFGTFTCEAENSYGSHNRSIALVQVPVVEGFSVDGNKVSWVVHSHTKLKDMVLQLINLDDEESSRKFPVPLPQDSNVSAYPFSYVLENSQLTSGKYQANIFVENEYKMASYGPYVHDFDFNQAQSMLTASVLSGVGNNAPVVRPTQAFVSTLIMYLLVRLL